MNQSKIDSVCIMGLGYIGLPTAAVVASRSVKVLGVDVKSEVVDTINRGEIHIVEPDLEAVTAHAVSQGFLRAATKPDLADVFVIAVPTPFSDGKADLTYVHAAARALAPVLRKGNLIIVESTSPPGTTEQVADIIAALRPDLLLPQQAIDNCDIHVAYCPERVLPGRVLTELVENNRVIGGLTAECSVRAQKFYAVFCKGALLTTNARTAEMCKLTENSFRDVNIAFANELSVICDKLGINVWELIALANGHPRVNILQPGPGVGGHCIAVDPWFIVEAAPDDARIIRAAREINDDKPKWVIDKVRRELARINGTAKVACLGLAFKANVDDLRESPALEIVQVLTSLPNVNLLVCEPFIEQLPKSLSDLKNVQQYANGAEAVADADIVLLLVNHTEFQEITVKELNNKAIIDTRGLWA